MIIARQRILSREDRFERQPAVSADGRIVSLFDGRLDNRADLLRDLGIESAAHCPAPDGVLALQAYARWREDAPRHLLGDFAWAVWDQDARRLLLARDHSQTRCLFYVRTAAFAAFATGYRPLLALPDVSGDIDELAVAELLLTCPSTGPRTFYRAIRAVPAAARVVIDPAGIGEHRFWEPSVRETLRLRADGDYVEAARHVFDEAVSARLRVQAPVVSALSGGLDSSAVAATAARLTSPGRVTALTMIPGPGALPSTREGWYNDERPLVRQLSGLHPNLDAEELAATGAGAIELDPAGWFLQAGCPTRGPWNTGWFLPMLQRAQSLGAATLLDGSWGNYTFSAVGLDRLSGLRHAGRWGELAIEIARLRGAVPKARWVGLLRYHGLRLLPPGLQARLRAARRPPAQSWRTRTFLNAAFFEAAGLQPHYDGNAVLSLHQWAQGARAATIDYIVARSRMQAETSGALRLMTGVTLSDPFADRRVIEFCLSLPGDQFQRGAEMRSLARRAFADRLPAAILANRRRGIQNPDWHSRLSPHRDQLAAGLSRIETSPLARSILDLPRMRQTLEAWPDTPPAGDEEARFKVALGRALHVGQFLRWVDPANQ